MRYVNVSRLRSHVTPVLVCVSEISERFTTAVTHDTCFSMSVRYLIVSRLQSHVTPVLVCVNEICKRFMAPVTHDTCFSMCR